MAEPKENPLMEKIVSLCKRRGFIFQSSEIYGGINGFWDYGPLGAELKRNVKELWWNTMTRQRDDVVGLEATIIMSPEIWKASGHVETFADMMRECPMTKKRVRADQVEPQSGTAYTFEGAADTGKIEPYLKMWDESQRSLQLTMLLKKYEREQELISQGDKTNLNMNQAEHRLLAEAMSSIKRCPITVLLPAGKPGESAKKKAEEYFAANGFSKPFLFDDWGSNAQVKDSTDFHPESGFRLTDPRPFNLMFKTYVGPVEDKEGIAYLRPETAQAIFAQFKNVLETSRQKVPFGIAQVGKAFRNEVTPRNFTFRSREFEQMELEFFIKPDEVVEAIAGCVATVEEISGRADLPVGLDAQQRVPTTVPQPNWGWQIWHKYWVEERVRFYEGIGLSRDTLGFHVQTPEELAHYARATTDILYKFPFSKRNEKGELIGDELEGIAARSDFDLSQHERFSGKSMGVFDEELRAAWSKLDDAKKKELSERYYESRKKYLTKTARPGDTPEKIEKEAREDAEGLAKGQYIPHVIEPSAGVDRLILALICNAYYEDQMPDEKGKLETRVVMKFHPRVAPIKAGVLPLLKNKPELVKKALGIRDILRPHMNIFYDDAGAIGRRYRRQDEAGTPFCVTVDFETLEGAKEGALTGQTDTVTLRYRDDGRQDRVKISDLLPMLLEKIH